LYRMSLPCEESYYKNLNIIRTLVCYTPQTSMGRSWENFSSTVQYAPVLCNLVKSCLLTQNALLGDNAGVTWQW